MKKLVIYKNDLINDDFVYNYIPKVIYSRVINNLDFKRLKLLNNEFNIDSYSVIKFALSNLSITRLPNEYIVEIDSSKWLKSYNLIKSITYGNRTAKGYPIIDETLSFISDNIQYFIERWKKDGY